MKLRLLGTLAATGLAVAAGVAAEPAKLPAPKMPAPAKAASPAAEMVANQKLVDAVAGKLTNSPAVMNGDVSLMANGGVVTVTGTVKSAADKDAVLKMVSTTAGVTQVRDGLKTGGTVKQAQAIGGPLASPMPIAAPPAGAGFNPDIEPLPLGPAGGGGMVGAPPLPPHAWPTYAPYNNASRVAYPTAYPHNAFPFIGPFYPYPKVPLGWRSVTLSWEDGNWYLGRKQAPVDYWRVKFW